MTEHDKIPISPSQEIAIAALIRGASVTIAAKEAGVSRQTVSNWKNNDAEFLAALNRGRRDVWENAEDRLRDLATKALNRLDESLDSDQQGIDTAIQILRLLGRVDLTPKGPTSSSEIAHGKWLNNLMYSSH